MGNIEFFKFMLLSTLSILIFSSCGSEDENKTAKVSVSLVDAPADYEEVWIDIQDIQVNVSSDENDDNGWQSLDGAQPGVYDLLKLTNGEEQFLGDIELPEGQLGQVRLILGNANELTIDGTKVALTVPSGSQSGLKLNVGTAIEAGISYKLVIDFDAAKSIVSSGNSGKYILKPVIKAVMEAQTGAIEGIVSPANINSVIYAIIGADSASTYPNEQGQFLIRTLDAGNYSVVAIPDSDSGLGKATVDAISVTIGEVNTLTDTLKFQN